MISTALVLMLVYAGPNAVAESREAYARCLKDFVRTSSEKKMEPSAFDAAIMSACKDKEAMLRTALTSADLAMGLKRAASEKSTSDQIADYLSMAKEDYKADFETAPKPQP
jgi:hypothetical protein